MLYVALAYLTATACYGILGILVLGRRGEFAGPDARLQVAAWGSAACSLAVATLAFKDRLTFSTLTLIDLAHAGLWLGVLAGVARVQSQPRWLVLSLNWAGPVALLAGGLLVLLTPAGGSVAGMPLSRILAVMGLSLALLGVLGFEQAYRNSVRAGLTLARFIFLAFAVLFVANLFWYGAALLLRAFDTDAWALRGFLLGFIALPIAFATRRMSDWAAGLTVSRQVVFYTTSFLLVGAYLVLMSLGGCVPARKRAAMVARRAERVSGDRRADPAAGWCSPATFAAGCACSWPNISSRTSTTTDSSGCASSTRCRNGIHRRTCSRTRSVPWRRSSAARTDSCGHRPVPGASRRSPPGRASTNPLRDLPSFDANDELIAFMLRTNWVVDLTELARRPDLYDRMRCTSSCACLPTAD